ncbi:MAG: metallophosphoesterase [Magnetococcales bacterium]|nr:metallophosphoesterase [Magnetococcales bacterium]
MAVYAIGDIHGCAREFEALLRRIAFNPQQDRLCLVGDLINRGPFSLEVVRMVRAMGPQAVVVMGNHELRALFGMVDNPSAIFLRHSAYLLEAVDAQQIHDWLKTLPLLYHDEALGWSLVHAALSPLWGLNQAQEIAQSLSRTLAKAGPITPSMRYHLNILTKGRLCSPQGEFLWPGNHAAAHGVNPYALPEQDAITPFRPWFEQRQWSAAERVVFGHWATAGLVRRPPHCFGIDSGCVYGGKLTALRLDDPSWPIFQVDCQQYIRLNYDQG